MSNRQPYAQPSPPRPLPSRAARRSAGFTLVELLIVIGIILVLAGLILPAVGKAYTNAERARMAFDIQAIVVALEAYKQDHGDIPRTSPSGAAPYTYSGAGGLRISGAQILCRALLGPGDATPVGDGDGADGLGFRSRPALMVDTNGDGTADTLTPQGKVQGPYLDAAKFNIGNPDGTDKDISVKENRNRAVILDRNRRPILYYPGLTSANINANDGYVSAMTYTGTPLVRPMFNTGDTLAALKPDQTTGPLISEDGLRLLLGDASADANGNLTAAAKNGKIDPATGGARAEVPAFKGPYLLVSAGPDEFFGPADTTKPISSSNPCDDVLNFERSPDR